MDKKAVAKIMTTLSDQLKKSAEEAPKKIIEPRKSVGYILTGILLSQKPEIKDVHLCLSITMSEDPVKVEKYLGCYNRILGKRWFQDLGHRF